MQCTQSRLVLFTSVFLLEGKTVFPLGQEVTPPVGRRVVARQGADGAVESGCSSGWKASMAYSSQSNSPAT